MSYADFLERKAQLDSPGGFDPIDVPDFLFDFKQVLVEWAVRQAVARSSPTAEWARPRWNWWANNVHRKTGKLVMLFTPLAVGFQIEAWKPRSSATTQQCRETGHFRRRSSSSDEQIEKFNPADFGGVVCDESSAIKAFDGQRRIQVTEFS